MDDEGKVDLLSTIIEELERLNRFIANLLDMTRLEAGSINPNTSRQDIGEIVGTALERATKILADTKSMLRSRPTCRCWS